MVDKVKGIDGWNAGLLTKDEARELLGMEPCAEGGYFIVATSNLAPCARWAASISRATSEGRTLYSWAPGPPLAPSSKPGRTGQSRLERVGFHSSLYRGGPRSRPGGVGRSLVKRLGTGDNIIKPPDKALPEKGENLEVDSVLPLAEPSH